MPQIKTISSDHFQIPLPVTLTDATHGEMSEFDIVTVRIRDKEGDEGLGYTYCGDRGAASAIQTLVADGITPLLIDQDANRIEHLWQKMWWGLHYTGRGGSLSFAMSALDIALWDLKAKKLGTPLWQLLGGHSDKVRAYAGGIELFFPLEQLLEQTRQNLDKGFRAIKMKVGRPKLSDDISRVAAMRKELGDDFPLMVDANMGWRPDQAITAAKALAPFNLTWLEEPTIPDDFQGYAKIQKEGGIPIAAGENFHTLYEFQHLLDANGVSFPEPDVANCGGVSIWIEVAHVAEAYNLPVTSHGVHDLTVHLLAAVPNKSFLEVHGFGLDKYIRRPFKVVEGFATAPDQPGHGVEFDWEALERHRSPSS